MTYWFVRCLRVNTAIRSTFFQQSFFVIPRDHYSRSNRKSTTFFLINGTSPTFIDIEIYRDANVSFDHMVMVNLRLNISVINSVWYRCP